MKIVSLMVKNETLTERITKDVVSGIRSADVLERSIARIPLYQSFNSVKVETDGKEVRDIAKEIYQSIDRDSLQFAAQISKMSQHHAKAPGFR